MIITLDNGQTVTIYEQNNLLKQIEPYIDKEVFELLEDKEEYEDNLESEYDDLYDKNKQLEKTKDNILDMINGLAIELSKDNIEEIKSKLQHIYYNN